MILCGTLLPCGLAGSGLPTAAERPKCSTLVCPDGTALVPDAKNIECAGDKCDAQRDKSSCCYGERLHTCHMIRIDECDERSAHT